MTINADLWEHQISMHNHAIHTLRTFGFSYWYAGCATGKTLSAYQVFETAGWDRMLVITTKAGIMGAWMKDGEKFTEGYTLLPLIKGSSKQKAQLMLEHKDSPRLVVIVNYRTARLITKQIKQTGFDFAVADESHRLKSYNSKQSVELAEACANIPYKLAMTGTGWDDSPLDLYGQYRWLTPQLERGNAIHACKLFGRWHRDFYPRYATFYTRDNIPITTGYKNIEELTDIVAPSMLKVKTEDVRDLPEYQVIDRYVDMPKQVRDIQSDLVENSIALIDDAVVTVDNPLVLSMRLHQLSSGYIGDTTGKLQELKANPKLEEALAIVEEVGGEPMVIFTRFTVDLNQLRDKLQKQGYSVAVLSGEADESEVFKRGDADIIIANISAGAEAVDLSRARYCLYYSVDYSRTLYEQSRWRIRRHEGDYIITYFRLMMRGSVDETIYKALDSKGDLTEEIANGIRGLTDV